MADEAVVRIVLEDKGGTAPPAAGTSGQLVGADPDSPRAKAVRQAILDRTEQYLYDLDQAALAAKAATNATPAFVATSNIGDEQGTPAFGNITPPQQAVVDTSDEDKKWIEEYEKRQSDEKAESEAFWAKQRHDRELKLIEDAAIEARKAEIELENRERELLEIEAHAALDVAKDARKAEIALEERERELLDIEARAALDLVRKQQEAAILDAEPVFDPVYEAGKRHQKKKDKEAIDEAYEDLYGEKKEKGDPLMELMDSLRGTLGGAMGKTGGAMLDAGSAFAKMGQGGAGAAGGMAAIAGPIAIAMAVKEAIDAATQAAIGGVKAVIGGIGGLAAGIANANADPSVPIGQLGNAASEAGEKIAKLSPLLGIAVVAFGEMGRALAGVMTAIDKTAERYGEFNAQIAHAQAVAEVRQTMGDLRRSQEVGPELVRYIQAQSDLQQKFEDIKVRLLVKMLPAVTKILEMVEAAMGAGEGAIEAVAAPLKAIAEVFSNPLSIRISKSADDDMDKYDPTTRLFGDDFMTAGIGMGTGSSSGLVPRV